MTSSQEDNILHASIPSVFGRYALPSIVTMLFFGLQSVIDGYISGNYIGEFALGGTNIVTPIFSLLMVISLTVGIGCQTLIGHGFGEGNTDKAQTAMTTGFVTLSILGTIASLLLWFFAGEAVVLLGADEVLRPYALDYMRGFAPFILPISLCFYSDLMLKAMGHPLYSTIIMGSAVVLNILLGIWFVVYLEMGTYGTALSTGIAFSCAFVASAVVSFSSRQRISMLRGRFDRRMLTGAVFNGASEGVSELATAISMLIINLIVVERLGASGISAYTTLNYINFIGVLLFLGISDGLIPVMSFIFGARDTNRMRAMLRFTMSVNAIIGLVVFAALMLWGEHLLGLFLTDHTSVTFALAVTGVRIYAFVFLFNGINIFVTSFFTAIGNPIGSIVIATLRGLVFLVIGMLALPRLLGDSGLWTAIPVAELLTLIVTIYLLRHKLRELGIHLLRRQENLSV